ncbi:MAG: hypothetical protein IPN34_13350 [Planctomycetes bacterium]|nr:hypothetical protein [Planctomycetota bacterium]
MKSPFASVWILLSSATLSAQQTTIDIRTDGPCAVLAQSGTQQDFEGVAAGTPIGSSNRLYVNALLSQGTYLSATTIAYPTQPFENGIGCNFFERAYARGAASDVAGTSASPAATGAQHGPHALLLSFQNTPGTAGKIVFHFRANPGTTGSTSGAIDLDNNGTIEFRATQTATQEFPFTFGPTGSLDLRVLNDCSVRGTGNTSDFQSAWTEIWVGFLPDLTATSSFTSYGAGCSGAQAFGGDVLLGSNRVVTMLVSGAFPNDPVLGVSGTQPLNIPLPGGCSLLATVEVVTVLTADASGNATQTWTMPATLTGIAYHQFLPLSLQSGALVLRASDGVRMELRR